MYYEQVIFAIDNDEDLHTSAKFLRYLDTLKAVGKLKGNVSLGIGSYLGVLERCYMMRAVDFDEHVAHTVYLRGQESVLRVPGDTRQPCVLQTPQGRILSVGRMRVWQEDGTPSVSGWTYMDGKYWVCEPEEKTQ